eukprot:IDg3602t1
MAMTVLNGLPLRYNSITAALDAIREDHDSLSIDNVRSRLLRSKKRPVPQTRQPPNFHSDVKPICSLKHRECSLKAGVSFDEGKPGGVALSPSEPTLQLLEVITDV